MYQDVIFVSLNVMDVEWTLKQRLHMFTNKGIYYQPKKQQKDVIKTSSVPYPPDKKNN